MSIIKAGYLISYDYEFVKTSLPRIYPFVSEIIFAVDAEGKTWSGQDLEIPESFWKWIEEFDTERKITIYKDRFYLPELTAIACDTRERNLLGKRMGKADWYVQIDSDEYFVDFGAFVEKLKSLQVNVPTSVLCRAITVFKKVDSGYLLADDSVHLTFATNNPVYHVARHNDSENQQVYWDDLVLHQSWARSPEEIYKKLTNWGHKDDFNTDSFYKLWNAIDEFNFYCLRNFHPLVPEMWPKLELIHGNINEILNSVEIRRIAIKTPVKRKSLLSRLWKEFKSR